MSEESKGLVESLNPEVVDALAKSSKEELKKATSEELMEYAKEMGEAAEKNPDSLKIENQAPDQQIEFVARFFHMYLPIFKQKFKKLSNKAKDRVVERLLEYPLGETKSYKWPFKEEKDLFMIGDRLLESKYAMFRYIINDELQKAGQKKPVEENKQLELPIEGESNGKNEA